MYKNALLLVKNRRKSSNSGGFASRHPPNPPLKTLAYATV